MKKVFVSLLVITLLAVGGFAFFLWQQGPTYRPSSSAPVDVPPPVAVTEPAIRYPVPENPDKALPPLEKSDSTAMAALADVFGAKAVKQLFVDQEVIRRIVVTVDNLPRDVVSAQLQPTTRVPGSLRTSGKGLNRTLSSANFKRYTPFIRVADAVDASTFATTYVEHYPLFQQAYRELGYPNGYFNDRLIEVIDHMLEAPEIDGPIALIQPHVFYKFADPELQKLSAGHKLMLRIGNDNAQRVKNKLAAIRSELVKAAPKEQ